MPWGCHLFEKSWSCQHWCPGTHHCHNHQLHPCAEVHHGSGSFPATGRRGKQLGKLKEGGIHFHSHHLDLTHKELSLYSMLCPNSGCEGDKETSCLVSRLVKNFSAKNSSLFYTLIFNFQTQDWDTWNSLIGWVAVKILP